MAETEARQKPRRGGTEQIPGRKKVHLPAGNTPSPCLPVQLLFFEEIDHWYPTLKENRLLIQSANWDWLPEGQRKRQKRQGLASP